MEQEKIKIRPGTTGWILEAAGVAGIVLTFVLAGLNYPDLPERIPRHYDGSGKPDGFSMKDIIWTLPLIALGVYVIFSGVLWCLRKFAIPGQDAAQKAWGQYRDSILMLRFIKTIAIAALFYVTYGTIQNGLGNMNGLSPMFQPVFLTAMFTTIAIFVYRILRQA